MDGSDLIRTQSYVLATGPKVWNVWTRYSHPMSSPGFHDELRGTFGLTHDAYLFLWLLEDTEDTWSWRDGQDGAIASIDNGKYLGIGPARSSPPHS